MLNNKITKQIEETKGKKTILAFHGFMVVRVKELGSSNKIKNEMLKKKMLVAAH